MEGPSLYLAAEQLSPFVGKRIQTVSGNTKIEKERLLNEQIKSVFSYGKYLFFQFDTFALRTHFLLFGSFEASVNDEKVTGDYPKKIRIPRLAFSLANGHVEMFNCSIGFIESANAHAQCDYTIDIMSDKWDGKKALKALTKNLENEIADVLLDQTIFLGVGNIIKNEVLLLCKISPLRKVRDLKPSQQKNLIKQTRDYVVKFYEWRKNFELRKHYKVYKQKFCKECGSKIQRIKTGKRMRISYICPTCEK